MRGVLAVIAGIVAGFAATIIIGLVAGMIVPRPAKLDGFSGEQLIGAFPGLPMAAKIAILLSWLGGALAGAAVAKRISRRAWAAWTVTGFFTLYVLLTTFVLPMPPWLQVTAVLCPLIAGLVANHLVAGGEPEREPELEPETRADASL